MVSTAIRGQVKAFARAVSDARRPTTGRQRPSASTRDTQQQRQSPAPPHRPPRSDLTVDAIQELVVVGLGVSRSLNYLIRRLHGDGASGVERRDEYVALCRDMLATASDVIAFASELTNAGQHLERMDKYEDAILETRQLLAQLSDAPASDVPPKSSTFEQFAKLAETSPPDPSWFEEDFDGLAERRRR